MPTAHFSTIYISQAITLKVLQNVYWQQQVEVLLGSILICITKEKFVYPYWALGEEAPLKCGILSYQQYFNWFYQFKRS